MEGARLLMAGMEGARRLRAAEHDAAQGGQIRLQVQRTEELGVFGLGLRKLGGSS